MRVSRLMYLVATLAVFVPLALWTQVPAAEAPAGFDNQTNGFTDQATMDAARETFEERDDIAKGLGPVYNAQSCAECHQNPTTGGSSQVSELRAAPSPRTTYPWGSLINDRAIDATIQAHVPPDARVMTFRSSLNLQGDGFVEVIDDATLQRLANASGGQTISVQVLENGATRLGRFGWKNQHASLLSFAGDAYVNEMGITNRLFPTEHESNGRSVAPYDTVADPEDVANDVDVFAAFMRSLKVPPRGPIDNQVNRGAQVFAAIGCASCHVANIRTAPANSNLPGYGTVPPALGSKVIHPYSDFALHDVGTGDGIIQAPAPANKMRTAPLWGLRTRDRFMHDLQSVTLVDAIRRHGNEAATERAVFNLLPLQDRASLLRFLNSL